MKLKILINWLDSSCHVQPCLKKLYFHPNYSESVLVYFLQTQEQSVSVLFSAEVFVLYNFKY